MEEIDLEKLEQEMEERLKTAMYDAMDDLDKALDHESAMLNRLNICMMEYELRNDLREAEVAYNAAKQAVADATKTLREREIEYYRNLKCTFCGGLDSICGGDHSEEMYWLSQPRYS